MSQKEQTILIVKRDNSRYNVLNLASFDEQKLAAEGISLIRREREGGSTEKYTLSAVQHSSIQEVPMISFVSYPHKSVYRIEDILNSVLF